MPRRIALLLSLPGLLLTTLAVPAAVVAGDPCFHSMARPAPTTGAAVEIAIDDCVFIPTVSYVPVGATVEWKNSSFQAHEVAGAHLTWGAHDKLLNTGDTIGWTFDTPGVYAYSCMLHPGMTGAIVVGDGAAASKPDTQAAAGDATRANPPDAPTGADSSDPAALLAAGAAAATLALGVLALGLVRRRRDAPAS